MNSLQYHCRPADSINKKPAYRGFNSIIALAGVLCFLAFPRHSVGQLTLTSPQSPDLNCGSADCCTEFTIAGNSTVEIDIFGTVTPTATNCFAWECLTDQTGGNLTISHTANTNTFVVTNAGSGELTFTLCGGESCMASYDLYSVFWHNVDGSDGGYLSLNTCGGTPEEPCNNCDQIRAWPDNTVCVTKGLVNNTQATSFTFTFSPSLPSCVRNTSIDGHGWTPSLSPGGSTTPVSSITFTGSAIGGPTLSACETFCFKLPDCVDGTYTTISVAMNPAGSPAPSYPCDYSISFKEAIGGNHEGTRSIEQESNFPNPLTLEGLYETTIPVELIAAGSAVLSIVDETGRVVYSDSKSFEHAGKHSFEFSGKTLAAGRYFYSVESPKGVVILQKSLLIVK